MVEGDWGLSKNVHVTPTVYGGRYVDPAPHVGHYYPSAGHQPGYGRLEIEPPANRRLPQPAESYHQSWSAQSTPQPVQPEVPFYPPPIIVAPQGGDAGMPGFFASAAGFSTSKTAERSTLIHANKKYVYRRE